MSDVVGTSKSSVPETEEELPEVLKREFKKYIKCKLICDTLEKCTEEDNLTDTLQNKIKEIVLDAKCSEVLGLDDHTNLFGLPEPTTELNFTESKELDHFLTIKLQQECETIAEILKSSEEDFDESVVFEYKNKLTKEQELYVENLMKLHELLEEMTNLRLKKVPGVMDQKIKETSLQLRLNHLKSQIAKEKVRVDIFTETSSSLRAYKEILKDIREQQAECREEIDKLKELQEKYKQVSCKQYEDILKTYLQYKASLEKKKLISETLHD